MSVELDSWCPVCDRQVVPKCTMQPYHIQVPADPTHPQPVSPPKRLYKNTKGRHGLVHGTGRAPQVKTMTMHRLVVDDSEPVPLYCSDECRLSDAQHRAGLHMRYDPHSEHAEAEYSTPIPPLRRTNTEASCSSSSTSSDLSDDQPTLTFARARSAFGREKHERNRQRADHIHAQGTKAKPELYRGYMYNLNTPLVDEDGREILTGPDAEEHAMAPYRSQLSAARRSSMGVVSSVSRDIFEPLASPSSPTFSPRSAPSTSAWPCHDSDQEMLSKFTTLLRRRSESRTSLCPTSPTSPTYKERSIAPDSVKLALPNVKLRSRNHSLTSLSRAASASSTTSEPCPSSEDGPRAFGFGRSRLRRMSPTPIDAPRPGPAALERSYSTSMVPQLAPFREESEKELLYDAIPIPNSINRMRTTRVEKRIQRVDGVEQEVEVRVQDVTYVPVAPKPLFGPHKVIGPPLRFPGPIALPSTSA